MHKLILAAAMLLIAIPAMADDNVLNFYNWTDYIDPKAITAFEAQTGAKVRMDTYDSLETLEGKMLAGHSGYDIIVPTSEPTFSRLIKAGALLPLDKAKLPNLSGEDPALLQRVATSDPGNKFGAIYLWGTIGLGEIPSKIKALFPDAPLDSWDLLLKPENAKKIAGCGITMMDSATDVIPSVLKYLHHDPSSTDPKDLEDVEKTLMAIRPYIRTFASGGMVEALAAGQTCLGLDYSGDVIQAAGRAKEAKQAEVVYVAPKEFTQLWFDMLAIPKDAPHPDLALQFVNFILQPSVIAGVTNTVQYPNAVPASKPMVDAVVRDNPNVYPTEAALTRSFTVAAVNQNAVRARTRMWARFKAGH